MADAYWLIDAAKAQLQDPVIANLVSGAIGAVAGSGATQWVISRHEHHRRTLETWANVNTALAINFSITNKLFGYKGQISKKVRDRFVRENQAREAAMTGPPPRVIDYNADFETAPDLVVPIEQLKAIVLEKTGLQGKGLAALVDLDNAVQSVQAAISLRNRLIEEMRTSNMDDAERARFYFGLPSASAVDTRWPTSIDALYKFNDDAIYFAMALSEQLEERADAIRWRSGWFLRQKLVDRIEADFSRAQESGLFPNPDDFANWESSFRHRERLSDRVSRWLDRKLALITLRWRA